MSLNTDRPNVAMEMVKPHNRMAIRSFRDILHEETTGWSVPEILWLLGGITCITILTVLKSQNGEVVWYSPQKITELVAAITGCIAAILTGKAKLGAFIFGFINSVLYAYISYHYKYYGEVMVKVLIFMPLNIYGMTCWLKNIDSVECEVIKRTLDLRNKIIIGMAVCIATVSLGLLLSYIGGNRPYIDATTTVLATTGLILTINRYVQNWILWIVLNVISIWLWIIPFYKGEGQPVAILLMWCFYLTNSIVMYRRWKHRTQDLQKEIS
jgi:nicotinamide mononucleotide transporter